MLRRIAILLVCIALICSVCACEENKAVIDTPTDNPTAVEEISYDSRTLVEGNPETFRLFDMSETSVFYYDGDSQPDLYCFNLQSNESTLVQLNEFSAAMKGAATEAGLWILATVWIPNGEDFANGTSTYSLHFIDNNGSVLNETSVDAQLFADKGIMDMEIDTEGNIYILTRNMNAECCVEVFSNNQEHLESITITEDLSRLFYTNGAMYGYINDFSTVKLIEISRNKSERAEILRLDIDASAWLYGSNDDELLYISHNNIYGYNLESSESTKKVNLAKSSINIANIASIYQFGGLYYCAIDDYINCSELVVLSPGAMQKEVLTLATIHQPLELTNAVSSFNKKHSEYFIEIKDYSQGAPDINDSVTALELDIIAGNTPDLFYLWKMPVEELESQGILMDLLPIMESDSQIKRSDLVDNLYSLLESNGHLYRAVSNFNLASILGKKTDLGMKNGWSFDEMTEYIQNSSTEPPLAFGCFSAREGMFEALCKYNMDEFIDWESGTCNFHTESFKKILAFCRDLPSKSNMRCEWEDTPDLMADQRQLLAIEEEIYSFLGMQIFSAMYGDATTFIGFPGNSGNGSAFNPSSSFAISAQTERPKVAWEFIKFILSEEFQTELFGNGMAGFPTNKAALDKLMTRYETQTYTIEEDGDIWGEHTIAACGDVRLLLVPATEDEINELQSLLNGITTLYSDYTKIIEILNEEVQYYFHGDKPEEAVINNIQGRVQIYLSEKFK